MGVGDWKQPSLGRAHLTFSPCADRGSGTDRGSRHPLAAVAASASLPHRLLSAVYRLAMVKYADAPAGAFRALPFAFDLLYWSGTRANSERRSRIDSFPCLTRVEVNTHEKTLCH